MPAPGEIGLPPGSPAGFETLIRRGLPEFLIRICEHVLNAPNTPLHEEEIGRPLPRFAKGKGRTVQPCRRRSKTETSRPVRMTTRQPMTLYQRNAMAFV